MKVTQDSETYHRCYVRNREPCLHSPHNATYAVLRLCRTVAMEAGHRSGKPQEITQPWRSNTKCVRIKNIPSQWTEEPEQAQQALKDLLETRACLMVSHVIIKRTYFYQPKEGTEQQSFAHVWLYVAATDKKILDDISALTIQGNKPQGSMVP